MLFIGIDPGVTGAIATFDPLLGSFEIADMPVLTKIVSGKERSVVDEETLFRFFSNLRTSKAIVEDVGGIPGQSAPRAFSFGFGCGLIRMALLAHKIPASYVRPQEWKSALRAPKLKPGYVHHACQILPAAAAEINRSDTGRLPSIEVRSGRAAAAMLAWYGAKAEGLA